MQMCICGILNLSFPILFVLNAVECVSISVGWLLIRIPLTVLEPHKQLSPINIRLNTRDRNLNVSLVHHHRKSHLDTVVFF